MLIVQKFGGSSVADPEKIARVAGIIADTYREGNDVVVVLSAQGDTTDDLIAKAHEINERPSQREMDMLLSVGEQISVALMSMQLEKMQIPAVSLAAWQVGFHTNHEFGNARIRTVSTERLKSELDRHRVVLFTGFQGITKNDDVTTLGRGGSDTTAVALAAVLNAEKCQIYTDVEGVFTADPRIVPGAKKLQAITYDEMLELASMGSQVLHNRSVEMAKRYHVDLEVLSSYVRKPGTKVKEVLRPVERTVISGIAKDTKITRITVCGVKDEPGVAFNVFSCLAKANVSVDLIIQTVGKDGLNDLSFTVKSDAAALAAETLRERADAICFDHVAMDNQVAKISVVGAGLMGSVGVASKVFEALYNANINIQAISTSEIKISVLIAKEMADRAVNVIHDKFFED